MERNEVVDYIEIRLKDLGLSYTKTDCGFYYCAELSPLLELNYSRHGAYDQIYFSVKDKNLLNSSKYRTVNLRCLNQKIPQLVETAFDILPILNEIHSLLPSHDLFKEFLVEYKLTTFNRNPQAVKFNHPDLSIFVDTDLINEANWKFLDYLLSLGKK